jgi:hypothetical protein
MSYSHLGAPTEFNGTNPDTGGDSSKFLFFSFYAAETPASEKRIARIAKIVCWWLRVRARAEAVGFPKLSRRRKTRQRNRNPKERKKNGFLSSGFPRNREIAGG